MTDKDLDIQARRFHKVLTDFVKKYQLRNRNDVCCDDVTVAQCYTMEAVADAAMTMNELAKRMQLSISTMTRTVDQLVEKGYAARYQDARDRRVWYVTLTERGKKKMIEMDERIMEYEKSILTSLDAPHREQVIQVLIDLSRAVDRFRANANCVIPEIKKVG